MSSFISYLKEILMLTNSTLPPPPRALTNSLYNVLLPIIAVNKSGMMLEYAITHQNGHDM